VAGKKRPPSSVGLRTANDRLPQQVIDRLLLLQADWWPARAIQRQIEAEFGSRFVPSEHTIAHYRTHPKHAPKIAALRAALAKRIEDVPISHKRFRLLVAQRELAKARRWYVKGYDKEGRAIFHRAFDAIEGLLRLAAQETGGLAQPVDVRLPSDQPLTIRVVHERPGDRPARKR
jgi:hypothetical protein